MFEAARWRLVAWNVLVFGILLFLIEVAAYEIFKSRIYSGVDTELRHQEQFLLGQLPAMDNNYNAYSLFVNTWQHIPSEYHVIAADTSGKVRQTSQCPNPLLLFVACYGPMTPLSAGGLNDVEQQARRQVRQTASTAVSPDLPLVSTIDDIRTSTLSRQPWRVLTFAILVEGRPTGIFQIARTVSGEASALQELRILFVFAGIVGFLLAGFGSLFLAGRALVPIRQAFGRQRQFTADASHELRTPLALIRANAEMLYRHVPGAESELVGEIIRETDHLHRLVGDLLTLARADAESLKLASRPVDFRDLVVTVHEDLHAIASSRGIETALSLNGPVTVTGDEGRLRQLLLILLDNALKYTDPGGRVDVSVLREDNRARLVVRDTGIGIPTRDQAHIFDRFYRVDRAREHESGGTGLGLAIARWIVQAHHGTIKVESEVGQGSRFQVDLPSS